ncbi:MAG: NAD(P)-dependent oxidoreductase [Alphaproteobacteria bacterium]|nr:NAD(P)-dependent oxidoreductase [Alphaproteobacteria bacterium]
MRVLVTGAAGFCGRAIARWLRAEGHDVVVHHRISALPADLADGETWQGDLADDAPLPERLDAIVHAAATSPPTGASDAVPVGRLIRDNAMATARLAATDVDMFVYLSSLSIHGIITDSAVTPDTAVTDPDSYGLSKLLGERAVAERAGSGLAIRLPAVIGNGAARNWPVQVLEKIRAGETVRIFNAASAFNNVVHVQDVAAFVAHALTAPPSRFAAVPVASRGAVRVRDVPALLAEAMGAEASVEAGPAGKTPFTVDIAAAVKLGFAPRDTATALRDFARETNR